MASVRVITEVTSDQLSIPALKQFIGKEVSITIEETSPEATRDRWKALQDAAGKNLVDPEVYKNQRAFDAVHGNAGNDPG